jgi:hypothetical protein
MGPIGLIIDLHSAWHEEVLRASSILSNMGASIIIPSGPPPAAHIALGMPLSSNYSIPKRATVPPSPEEATVRTHLNPRTNNAIRPRDEQRPQSVQDRADYYGPASDTASGQHASCEGCGRKGHTTDHCAMKAHPNWNAAHHGHVLFVDTAAGQAIAREARGTYLISLPPLGVVWEPISQQWEECEALHEWRRKIERTSARSAARSVPSSAAGPRLGQFPNLPASLRGLLP